jgi:hypothetical protein
MMGGSTMKAACTLLLGLAVVFTLVVVAQAEDKKDQKEVTLTGKIVCGKCTLNETAKCSNVLQVTEGGKEVNYYLKDKGKPEKYHSCAPSSSKKATVTGTVATKDGKKMLTPTKVTVNK